jgi:putative MATE family efflux protein
MRLNRETVLNGNISSVIVRLFLPNIIGMLGMVLYNIVDTFFVGQLGTVELAAISFTFPVVMVLGSISVGLGTATMTLFSRAVGEHDVTKEKELATASLLLSLLVAVIIAITGFLTLEPVFRLLGADDSLMPYIKSYMNIWYFGAVFVVIPMTGDHILRGLGDTMTPSLIMLSAVIVNVILDPLFIFGIGPFPAMGISGAAIATVLARMITLVISLSVLHFRDHLLTFNSLKLQNLKSDWGQILFLGIPNGAIRTINPLGVSVFTYLLSRFGHQVVAGYGVAAKVEGIILAICGSLVVASTVFIGQNLGAGKFDRVKSGIKSIYWISVAWGILSCAILLFTGRYIGSLFNDDPLVQSTVSLYLLIVPVSYSLFTITQVGSSILNVYQKPFKAAGISALQMFVVAAPLGYFLSGRWGESGVFAAISFSYVIAGLVTVKVVSIEGKKHLYENKKLTPATVGV